MNYINVFLLCFLLIVVCSVSDRFAYDLEKFSVISPEFEYGFAKSSAIPSVIWTYWEHKTLPKIIQVCIDSWRRHNPGYKVVIITKENVQTYWPEYDPTVLKHNDSPARFSDFVRLNVLASHGGIWMDASIFCTKSLNWLHAHHNRGQHEFIGYFMQSFTTNPKFPVIESWFFACIPNSTIVNMWRTELMRINEYDAVSDYIHDVRKNGVDTQNIPSSLLSYLAIHVAAQSVLQKQLNNNVQKHVKVFKAEDGPFRYLSQNGWESQRSFSAMCEDEDLLSNGFFKMRGSERDYLERNEGILTACLTRV